MTDLTTLPFHLQLLVREYGHSTYQLIQGLAQIEDLAERTKRAGQIVQLMLRLQPSLRELPEVQTRLWNHLHAMAGEEVTLDAPVPLRSLTIRTEKPTRVPYPRQAPKLRAYGAAVEALIAKALTIEDPAEREQATVQIGRTMKFLYRQHNKENAKDVTILRHLGNSPVASSASTRPWSTVKTCLRCRLVPAAHQPLSCPNPSSGKAANDAKDATTAKAATAALATRAARNAKKAARNPSSLRSNFLA
ncbi:DUF4290 domain-containing protein [Hymenobacter humi]|uniref:DUF4290 domain-containing protein n=1 Tax=Hymenobacter humi TaxID=1411620 RepID=A0ABW2U558_9BACT